MRLCVTIGHFHPLFVSDSMLFPLMQHEQAERVTIALRALLELMFMAVSRSKTSSSNNELPNVRDQLVSLERNDRELQLLEYIRSGKHALTLLKLEERIVHIRKELSQCFRTLDMVTGFGSNPVKGSTSTEATKEPFSTSTMLAWCIRCIPYVLPSDWTSNELIETLARSSIQNILKTE